MAERLGDAAVPGRLARLDELLGLLERTPGATARTALEAAGLLAEVYGEALARALDRVSGDPRLVAAFLADELTGHLLALHGAHPEPAERRVARALEGTGAQLDAVDGRTARVRLAAGGCGCRAGRAEQAEQAVRDAVLAAAPELDGIEVVPAGAAPPAFVPVEALLHRGAG